MTNYEYLSSQICSIDKVKDLVYYQKKLDYIQCIINKMPFSLGCKEYNPKELNDFLKGLNIVLKNI